MNRKGHPKKSNRNKNVVSIIAGMILMYLWTGHCSRKPDDFDLKDVDAIVPVKTALRATPSVQDPIITYLPAGSPIRLDEEMPPAHGENEMWQRVYRANGEPGWIRSDSLAWIENSAKKNSPSVRLGGTNYRLILSTTTPSSADGVAGGNFYIPFLWDPIERQAALFYRQQAGSDTDQKPSERLLRFSGKEELLANIQAGRHESLGKQQGLEISIIKSGNEFSETYDIFAVPVADHFVIKYSERIFD